MHDLYIFHKKEATSLAFPSSATPFSHLFVPLLDSTPSQPPLQSRLQSTVAGMDTRAGSAAH